MKRVVLVLLFLMVTTPVFAGKRGALTNTYASQVSVTNTLTTITFPYNSRDAWIRNGDENDVICFSPNGATITYSENSNTCTTATDSFVTQLDPNSDLTLRDYVTGSMTFLTASNSGVSASPVSVIITY